MTVDIHGRTERQHRARRRRLTVLLGIALAVCLALGVRAFAAPPSGAASPQPVATAPSDELVQRFDAAATHGSETEAHRWVLPPEKSAHVQGLAIDVGPPAGAAWLGEHGAAFGLCRTYANEAWHFEPVIDPGGVCPEPSADSSVGW